MMKPLLLLALLIATLTATSQRPVDRIIQQLQQPQSNQVLVAAHRADWRNHPENSIAAIENAIAMGVDIIEVDLKKTKDGHLVILHDFTLNRTTTGKGKVEDLTLDSLQQLFLRNGYMLPTRHRIPTLEEVMLTVKGRAMINLDHGYPYIREAYAVLESTGTVDHALFKGDKPWDSVVADYGDIARKIHYMPIVELNDSSDARLVQSFAGARAVAFELVFDREGYKLLDSIAAIRRRGARVWVNTLWPALCAGKDDDSVGAWEWVVKKGFTIIQTDRPGELVKWLRRRGLHK